MLREDYLFCVGFEGSTAIVDGSMKRRYGRLSTRELAENGFFKAAIASAQHAGDPRELEEVLAIYNKKTPAKVASVDVLKRIFGTYAMPEEVKKIQVI